MAVNWTDFLRNAYSNLVAGLGYSPTVTSGLRTPADQQRLIEEGYSPATNSYHLKGQSLDLVPPAGVTMSQLYSDVKALIPNATELINEGDHVHVTFPGNTVAQGAAALNGATPATDSGNGLSEILIGIVASNPLLAAPAIVAAGATAAAGATTQAATGWLADIQAQIKRDLPGFVLGIFGLVLVAGGLFIFARPTIEKVSASAAKVAAVAA